MGCNLQEVEVVSWNCTWFISASQTVQTWWTKDKMEHQRLHHTPLSSGSHSRRQASLAWRRAEGFWFG